VIKLLYLVSHPIQYQAPLLRRIAAEPDIALRVVFERPGGLAFDPGFGRAIEWDQPLRAGYDNIVINETTLESEIAAADVVWVHGWQTRTLRRAVRTAHRLRRAVLMRGENADHAMPDGWGPRGWLKRRYLRSLFSACDAFLAIGSANRGYYRRHGVDEWRIFSVPYAIDNEFFAEQRKAAVPDRRRLRQELGVGDGSVLLYVGKLQPRKRPDLLVAAWQRAFPTSPRPALVFVGDGPMRNNLQGSGIHLLGFKNQGQLPALYDLADVVVLPSEREPWGLVINEAMACGRAVVASDQCGAAFDLIDESTGAIFRSGDADDLAAALVRVLDDARVRGEAARRRIADWDFAADVRGLCSALQFVASRA